MLRLIEYGLLAVSLIVIIALIVSGSRAGGVRDRSNKPEERGSAPSNDPPDTEERGKTP